MTSLLTTAVDEACHNHLRGRRRSSVRLLGAVPRFFSPTQLGSYNSSVTASANESAILDDIELVPQLPTNGSDTSVVARETIPSISPLSHAHTSDYASKMIVPRHQDSLGSTIEFSLSSSPSFSSSAQGSYPTTGINNRKPSYDDLVSSLPLLKRSEGKTDNDDKDKFERMKWRLAAGYFAYFLCGWGDGVTGTVLPMFMADFHISFSMSSLLFAGGTCGFSIGTFFVERIMQALSRVHAKQTHSAWYPYFTFSLTKKSSRTKKISGEVQSSQLQSQHLALLVSSHLHALFFVIMGTRGGFPALFLAYVVAAFARAILTAALNVYFATVMPQSLGYAFGLWSIGGVISPLICQTIVAAGVPWFQFYFGSLILSAFNIGFLVLIFRPTPAEWAKERREFSARAQRKNSTDGAKSSSALNNKCASQATQKGEVKDAAAPKSELRRALSLGYLWAFMAVAMIYCGCETTTQGFMVSYLLNTRNASRNTVGYVTSGFWGGNAIGRFAWGYFMPSFNFAQRKHIVHLCFIIALTMELLIWFVNSNIGNAFSASVIGMVFGPIFPAALNLANAILPAEVHMVSMALISLAASCGAAIFPFVAGVISGSKGIQTLTYVTVPLSASLVLGWFWFPSHNPGAVR